MNFTIMVSTKEA